MRATVSKITGYRCDRCELVYDTKERADKCCICPECKKKLHMGVWHGSACCTKCTLKVNIRQNLEHIRRAKRDLRTYSKFLKRDRAELQKLRCS